MSAYPNQQEPSDAQHAFLNDLLNSCFVASLFGDDLRNIADLCGELIVATHQNAPEEYSSIRLSKDVFTAIDVATADTNLGALVAAAQPRAPAHIDFSNARMGSGAAFTEPQPAARSYEETELELLKIAVANPDLYNNLRQVFVEHKDPEKLDDVGKLIRKFFINPKG